MAVLLKASRPVVRLNRDDTSTMSRVEETWAQLVSWEVVAAVTKDDTEVILDRSTRLARDMVLEEGGEVDLRVVMFEDVIFVG